MGRRSKARERRILFGCAAAFVVFLITYFLLFLLLTSQTYRNAAGADSTVCWLLPNVTQSRESFLDRQIFSIDVDAANIPHPEKQSTGGEDSFFVSSDKHTFCVFDGVGGWHDQGVDPGNYSRALAFSAAVSVEELNIRDPLSILCRAEEYAKHIIGTSTACCITIDQHFLVSANLGDSGFILIRNNVIQYQSPEMQHEFNFPYQIGTYGDGLDPTDVNKLRIQSKDIIVVGSDGLFDNLFMEEIVRIVPAANYRATKASFLATEAYINSLNLNYVSPHQVRATSAGFFHMGGKSDDITVLFVVIA